MDIGILTASDRAAVGLYKDESGPIIAAIVQSQREWRVVRQAIVKDEIAEITETLMGWCDEGLDLILTTGGTGFSSRDVTPEATLKIIDKETPGISEALRSESLKITRHAMLSRAVAGIKDKTLIINLPGSPKAVKENMQVLIPILPHAIELISGQPGSEAGHRTV